MTLFKTALWCTQLNTLNKTFFCAKNYCTHFFIVNKAKEKAAGN